MRVSTLCKLACIILSACQTRAAALEHVQHGSLIVYEVGKKVSAFPEGEDFSTPEAAYATINRLSASGDQGFWRRVTVNELASRIPVVTGQSEVPKTDADKWLNAKVVEVRIFRDRYAGVIAKVTGARTGECDYRHLEFEGGRWLNAGNDGFDDIEKARRHFGKTCARYAERPKRPKIADPESYLKPFAEFLRDNAQDTHAFVMKALREHKITIIGEVHHRPRYWAFNSSLVTDPDFGKYIGTIYMELPSNNQSLIDEFLMKEECDSELVIAMLRNVLWMGWPDQAMLDFFVVVWNMNRDLPADQRVRISLVDMKMPWEKIRDRRDLEKYNVDRDKYMAESIIRDIQRHPTEERNGMFCVGVGHSALGFDRSVFADYPLETAGWHLKQKLGPRSTYAIMQHSCAMTNIGRVDGRLQLGLFDSAFQVFDNKPVAFTLETGPFGEQVYDGQPDIPVWSKYGDGFNAYLYLGPLESESFSPLIEGFYTDEFVSEIDRRFRLMRGRGWAEAYGLESLNASNFIDWMSDSWGKPRKWRKMLGPIDAWRFGDGWQEEIQKAYHEAALEDSGEVTTAADKLFRAIRNADYELHEGGDDWEKFLQPEDVDYQVHHDFPGWVRWICKTFKDNPIQSVEVGEVSKSSEGLPAVSYIARLKDGKELKGNLPFRYMPRQERWIGVQGLDWHLKQTEDARW